MLCPFLPIGQLIWLFGQFATEMKEGFEYIRHLFENRFLIFANTISIVDPFKCLANFNKYEQDNFICGHRNGYNQFFVNGPICGPHQF